MNEKKWVLITGASTGIGRACAEYLSSNGFGVYACARKKKDIDDLTKIKNVVPLQLDVTKQKEVDAAVKAVAKKGAGLFGLVNNAGIAVAGPWLDMSDEDLRAQFDVNFFGVHRVTRAFLPMLMASHGRIVMMSSDSGFFATPFFGPYCSSKFALEGYSDSLRRELLTCGVKVMIIQPGMVSTPIWDKGEGLLEKYKNSLFAESARKIGEYAIKKGKSEGLPPVEIAKTVYMSLTKKEPKLRYLKAPDAFKYKMVKILPGKIVDYMIKKELS